MIHDFYNAELRIMALEQRVVALEQSVADLHARYDPNIRVCFEPVHVMPTYPIWNNTQAGAGNPVIEGSTCNSSSGI